MSKYRVLADGNGSDLINVVGLGYYAPLSRLEAHKRHTMQILQLNEFCQKHGIGNIGDDVHSIVMERIAKLTAERDAALAQNAELVAERNGLASQLKMIRKIFRDETISPTETMRKLPMVIDLTPQQCLRDIQAEAVRDAYKDLLHVVANQYGDDDTTEWSIGANHVFRLFAREISKRQEGEK